MQPMRIRKRSIVFLYAFRNTGFTSPYTIGFTEIVYRGQYLLAQSITFSVEKNLIF